MNIILLGLPGAGKGSFAKKLNDDYGMFHLSSGEILKKVVGKNTSLGKEINNYINKGELVPDDITVNLMKKKIKQISNKNIIFDGFPRSIKQAEELDKILKQFAEKIDLCIYLKVAVEELIKRISGRRICKIDGSIHNLEFDSPSADEECSENSGNLYIREDDKPEVVKKRIENSKKKTKLLANYYENKGILESIKTTDKSIDDSYEEMKNILVKYS